jgi:fatty-acyl-CoA synthase
VKAGFDPANISEPLYYADSRKNKYVKITPSVFKKICDGTIRL